MSEVNRNDPCPCGSGKKFKKCCESKGVLRKITSAPLDNASKGKVQKISSLLFHREKKE